MTAETKIIGETGSVPSKASDDQRAPVAAVLYARRKHPTLIERRYKTPARTSQTLHAIVQRKNFAEICPLVRIRNKAGAHRIFPNVFPFLPSRFLTAQQVVEKSFLPMWRGDAAFAQFLRQHILQRFH